nr:immunoglobulin light chain junction region [Macaca mulatta]MOW15935.1 immunoglobulin light chain junction region [Macaca mulatta]MOW15984.1 immunoglobulin light chain junction region [Macaca mulatta]MOW16024.1 immunoglobulin light chain junction region [Macaca mulatta]MOW16066.1 immunoglobulin light chain junction region [Macaca mulatta]
DYYCQTWTAGIVFF